MRRALRLLLFCLLFLAAGLPELCASIPKTRVGKFFAPSLDLRPGKTLQTPQLHLENWVLYDESASGRLFWTHFDPHGLFLGAAVKWLNENVAKPLGEGVGKAAYAVVDFVSSDAAIAAANSTAMEVAHDVAKVTRETSEGALSALSPFDSAASKAMQGDFKGGLVEGVKEAVTLGAAGKFVRKTYNFYENATAAVDAGQAAMEGDLSGAAQIVAGAALEHGQQKLAGKSTGNTQKHHSDPKFMGGDPNQKLTRIPEDKHKQLHRDLNGHLVKQTDEFGNHMRPQRGNPGAKIRENFSVDQRRDAMAEFYRQNELKYPEAARHFFDQHPDRR